MLSKKRPHFTSFFTLSNLPLLSMADTVHPAGGVSAMAYTWVAADGAALITTLNATAGV